MARAISQLSPKAQKVYNDDPALAAKRQQQQATRSASASTDDATSSSGDNGEGGGVSLPTFSDIPGGTPVVKALVVFGVLLLGLIFYSRVTGQPIALGLSGLSAPSWPAAPRNPNTLAPGYAQSVPATVSGGVDTMTRRVGLANPAKVGA